MQIPEAFYESEVREGYYVPSKMKRAWGAILTVLNEIDLVCKRHGLKWWMDFGSMLATVRHHGFIPWDDDVDIGMLREDYEAFLRYAREELPKGYVLFNFRNSNIMHEYFTRVNTQDIFNITEEYLEANAGFPYVAGVDLMCIDYISPKFDKEVVDIVKPIDQFADAIGDETLFKDIPEHQDFIRTIEKKSRHHFNRSKPLAQQLRNFCEGYFTMIKKSEAEYAGAVSAHVMRYESYNGIFPIRYYEELIEMPYEFMTVPVPLHYNEMISKVFGNYMQPYRGGGTHHYPYYLDDENYTIEILGSSQMPVCPFKKEFLIH
ncbi:MAG: LicD family protein [Lachnospiraceae bacterium]|nr:LicD family protein [Lachnospiraceae bacterium]